MAEYKYNGLKHRISVHQDTDADDDVDGNDKWFHFAYDERWRIIATFREADSDAKEAFMHHAAGLDGSGSSSYIDSVILRDRDANTAWTAASDGTLEERGYLCQNWRADLVALISDGRRMAEWAKYSAYGVPFGLPAGDTDSDGDCDATDITQIQSWIDAPAYDVRGDLDLDGDVDATDKSIAQSNFQGVTLGWDALSDYGNRRGYAGYEYDQAVSLYHVRNRVLDPHLGRWLRRDPLGYVDGMSLYEYVGSRAVVARDAWGLTYVYHADSGGDPRDRYRVPMPKSNSDLVCRLWAERTCKSRTSFTTCYEECYEGLYEACMDPHGDPDGDLYRKTMINLGRCNIDNISPPADCMALCIAASFAAECGGIKDACYWMLAASAVICVECTMLCQSVPHAVCWYCMKGCLIGLGIDAACWTMYGGCYIGVVIQCSLGC